VEGRQSSHALSLAHALNGFVFTELMLRANHNTAEPLRELEKLNMEHALTFYRAYVLMFRGWALSDAGKVEQGIDLIRRGIAEYHATGARVYATTFHRWLASACLRAGRCQDGLDELDKATRIANASGAFGDEGEIHRVRAELLVALGREADAEASYRAALEASERRKAKFWSLHAATGLARLLDKRGERNSARPLLSETLAWFTEGFETPDLMEAKALLSRLT
jgi:predicted ATPase